MADDWNDDKLMQAITEEYDDLEDHRSRHVEFESDLYFSETIISCVIQGLVEMVQHLHNRVKALEEK